MKKKITAMLLAICCISSTWTVYADDFSSGSSEVEIEITEDEDEDADDVEITEDADADDEITVCFYAKGSDEPAAEISVQWLIRS